MSPATAAEAAEPALPPTRRSLRKRRKRDPLGLVIGLLGELLITAGVLLGLFVAWQVWWTDIEARAHTEGKIQALGFGPASSQLLSENEKRAQAPPSPELTDDVIGVLHIPKFGSNYRVPIQKGVSLKGVLNSGMAGHYPDTAMVGQPGNFALAGHRQSYGAIFHHIDTLTPGDVIIVETRATWYVYRVKAAPYVVKPWATQVIAPVPGDPAATPTQSHITLTTCHPLWSVRERLIVHGEFQYWAPRSAGTPKELL